MSFIRAPLAPASVRAALLLFLFAISPVFLAGCASQHDHVAGTGLLFGVVNGDNETIEAGWTLTAPNGTIVWTRAETIDAGKTVERIHHPLLAHGEHAIDLSWGAGHAIRLTFSTADCAQVTHLVLTLRADGTYETTTRECHA